jgi:hypothetical protein
MYACLNPRVASMWQTHSSPPLRMARIWSLTGCINALKKSAVFSFESIFHPGIIFNKTNIFLPHRFVKRVGLKLPNSPGRSDREDNEADAHDDQLLRPEPVHEEGDNGNQGELVQPQNQIGGGHHSYQAELGRQRRPGGRDNSQ